MAELTAQQEAAVAAAVQQMYAAWLPVASAAVLSATTLYGNPPDPAAMNSTAELWQQQIRQLETQQLQPLAADNYDQEDPDGSFDATTALIVAAAAATLYFLMAQIGEIQTALYAIIAVSATTVAAVAGVSEFLSPSNPHWAAKAQQVAATEADRWAQAGTLAGAVRAEQRDGVRRQKIWQTRRDNLVRDAHREMQGRRVDLNVPFNVAGFPMMYPHDPSAPPELVVNCRCWIRIVKRGS